MKNVYLSKQSKARYWFIQIHKALAMIITLLINQSINSFISDNTVHNTGNTKKEEKRKKNYENY